MEVFPNGGLVRLQSRVNGMFVSADRDWEQVSLRPNEAGPILNSVWRVEHRFLEFGEIQATFVLLQNAAYGRYLSFTARDTPKSHRGFRTTQIDRNDPVEPIPASPWMWTVQRLGAPNHNQAYVRLCYFDYYLRANGRYRTKNIGVTADIYTVPKTATMMHWRVHEVAVTPGPVLPRTLPIALPDEDEPGRMMVFPHLWWTIRHVRASNEEGVFDPNHHNWSSFNFFGTSMIQLRYELGIRQHDWDQNMFAYAYTLCMRPGSHGRLMPLVADLPRCLDSMNIVVFMNGTPGAAALVYPAGLAP